MNTFDIIVVVVISFCIIRGYFKGLIGEVSGTIGVISAFYGAYTYYPLMVQYVAEYISSGTVQNIAAFFLLFFVILILIHLLALVIHKFLKFVFLGWVDRSCGLALGAVKGGLIVSVFFVMITTFLPDSDKYLNKSVCSPYIAQVSKTMTVLVSHNTKQDFLQKLEGMF